MQSIEFFAVNVFAEVVKNYIEKNKDTMNIFLAAIFFFLQYKTIVLVNKRFIVIFSFLAVLFKIDLKYD